MTHLSGVRFLSLALAVLALAGCKVGPDYQPPETEMPDLWHQELAADLERGESALIGYQQEQLRRDSLRKSVAAGVKSVELAEILYRTGVTNFQNALDMQRSLAEQQDRLASSEGSVVQYLVSLYKALAGGWKPDQPPQPKEDGEETAANWPPESGIGHDRQATPAFPAAPPLFPVRAPLFPHSWPIPGFFALIPCLLTLPLLEQTNHGEVK